MYTRAYYQDVPPSPPENYDGNAFTDGAIDTAATYVAPTITEPKISPGLSHEEPEECEPTSSEYESTDKKSRFGGFLSWLPFKSLRSIKDIGLHFGDGFDVEDIMLIAIAFLLFFSSEGDKLLALGLLALLFIRE